MRRAAIIGLAGPQLGADEAALLRSHSPAGVILFARNILHPAQLAELMAEIHENLPPDPVLMVDQEGGRVARLKAPHWRAHPPARAHGTLYATDRVAGLRAAWLTGALIGADCAAAGFTVTAAPVLDVASPDGHDVIGDRAFSADPRAVAALGASMAAGILAAGVQPVGKHAPGHGRARADSHLELPVLEDVSEADLLPFRCNAHLPWMMTAHIRYSRLDSRPATLSAVVIQEVIRATGFDGVLTSDDLAMQALRGTAGERARAALAAGCDVALHCSGILSETADVLTAVPALTEAAQSRLAAARAMAAAARQNLDVAVLAAERGALGVLNIVPEVAATVSMVVVAIVLHELAHGYAAWALGDQTARLAGRLSFNPLRHVDRFGTVILPGFLVISQLLATGHVLFMFGWAKPVPVNASVFKNPRRGMALVALAGPAMNFTLAFIAALFLRDQDLSQGTVDLLVTFISLNLVLGLFNLVPMPPLDGGRIAVGLLPLGLARRWAGMERYGLLVVMALMAGPALLRQAGIHFDPLGTLLGPTVDWAFDRLLSLAGVPQNGT